jgi:integrase
MSETPTPRARGSYRFRDGAWRIAVRAGKYPSGKPRWVNRTVKAPQTKAGERLAVKALALAVEEADVLKAQDRPDTITLIAAVDRYLAWGEEFGGKGGDGWSPTTSRNYHYAREKFIAPSAVATIPLKVLTVRKLNDLYAEVRKGHGASLTLQMHSVIHAAIAMAVADDILSHNVAASTRKPPRPKPYRKGVRKLGPALMADVLRHVDGDDPFLGAYLRLAALTGARRSTLVGLRWQDIDLDGGTITFTRAVVRGRKKADGGGGTGRAGYTVKGLKADNPYPVGIDPQTVAVLRRHRAWCARLRLAAGRDAPDWVFPSSRQPEHPIAGDAITTRWWRLRRAYQDDRGQLDGVRLHDLRHYVATRMFGKGYDPITVAGRLGHEDAATTMAIYSEFLPARDMAAALDLAGELDGETGVEER